MVLLNTSQVFGVVINNIAQYILGSSTATGLWILLLMFGVFSALNLRLAVGVVILIPITIVMLGYGFIEPVAGGIVILLSGVILAFHFLNR